MANEKNDDKNDKAASKRKRAPAKIAPGKALVDAKLKVYMDIDASGALVASGCQVSAWVTSDGYRESVRGAIDLPAGLLKSIAEAVAAKLKG